MTWQALADRCRRLHLGYLDGKPGTVADVEGRIADLEMVADTYRKTERHLLKRLSDLDAA